MNLTRKRRVLIWLNVVVMTILMGAFLVGVNLIAHTRYARIDMTTDKVWEITPQSRQILKNVKYDLEIYINPVENPQDATLPEAWRRTQLLLFEMSNQNSKIKVTPLFQGTQAQTRVMAVFSQPEPNMIYFVYRTADEKPLSRAIGVGELYTSNPQNGEVTDFFGESRIVATISQLISDRKIKIYHTIGHREIPPSASDRRGLSVLAGRMMALENAEFKPVDLARDKAVPEDADLVFIAAPVTDFTTAETDALTKYWGRGGRLFVAVNPPMRDPMDEFRKFLETCGTRLNRDIVIDTQPELQDPVVLVVRDYGRHPVNQHMVGLPFRFPFACSVDAIETSKRMQSLPIFYSSNRTWGETDLPPKPGAKHSPGERVGPIPLAVAAEEMTPGGRAARIITWGGATALTNEWNLIQAAPDDLRLGYMVNNFRWLMEREMLTTNVQPRKTRMRPFSPPPGANAVIGWISLAGIPLLGVALGALAWYFRRK